MSEVIEMWLINGTCGDKVPPILPGNETWHQIVPSRTTAKMNQMVKSVVKLLHAHTRVPLLFIFDFPCSEEDKVTNNRILWLSIFEFGLAGISPLPCVASHLFTAGIVTMKMVGCAVLLGRFNTSILSVHKPAEPLFTLWSPWQPEKQSAVVVSWHLVRLLFLQRCQKCAACESGLWVICRAFFSIIWCFFSFPFSRPVTCGWPTQRWSLWMLPPSLRLVPLLPCLCLFYVFFHDYFAQFWIILSVSSGLNHVDESLPFLLLLLLLSLFFRISFFVGPGHSVEHLLLSLWLLFQCELLPTNYPFTNTLFLPFCPLFLLLLLLLLSLLLPPLLLLHHLSIRPSCSRPPLHLSLATSTSLSLSLCLSLSLSVCLFSPLGVPGAERVQLGSGEDQLHHFLTQHDVYLSVIFHLEWE